MIAIREWLEGLGLGEYAEAFEAEKIDLDALPDVTDADLKEIGLPIGPRRKVLRAVSELSAESESPVSAPAREAERRQITVMFCDLVGSTALAEALDPEDLRALMQAYQRACAEVIERYEGHVAQYLGDGLMTYFGWPQAHEDDSERAVRAGLEIVAAVKAIEAPSPLRVRIGVATGPVVVGETGAGDASVPKLAVGETPNVAARLQGLAGADEIIIAATTRRLVGGTVEVTDLGEHLLKGIVEPVRAWRVTGLGHAEGRFEATRGARLTPLVGRETEIAMLMERWSQAKDGEGQVVLLCGEPGIGKSRVTQVLRERITAEPHIRLRYHCSPYHVNSALHPFIDQLERAAGFARSDSLDAKRDKLETALGAAFADIAPVAFLFADMLGLETGGRWARPELSPQRQKEATVASLARAVVGLTGRAQRPVLLLFEDAHWADPSTREALDAIIAAIETAPVLAVITFRPELTPPWAGRSHVTLHTLTRLGRKLAAEMVEKVTGGLALPDLLLDEIVARTDGVPLFVEELTKAVIESGILRQADHRYVLDGPLPPLAVPATLQDSLMARLDRLAPVKEVAQIGACIGREFSYELLAAVSPLGDNELRPALGQLADSELVFIRGSPPEAKYAFKHALVQEAAYSSLLKVRRQRLHAAIAEYLEKMLATETASPPELLAYHFSRAEIYEKAVHYWRHAGEAAAKRAANTEAAAHFTQALEAVRENPGRFDARSELEILRDLGPPLLAAKGWAAAEVGEVYERAGEIARRHGEPAEVFPPLVGLWVYRFSRGELQATDRVADELLDIARELGDADLQLQAHHAAWPTPMVCGEFAVAHEHIEKGLCLYDYERHRGHALVYMGHDPAVCGHALDCLIVWALGFPEASTGHADAALDLARRIGHSPTLAHALWYVCKFRIASGDVEGTRVLADELLALCEEHRLLTPPYFASRAFKGWALAQTGDAEVGIPMMEEALADWRSTGGRAYVQHRLSLLADAHLVAGEPMRATALIDQAFETAAATGEQWFDAKLHLLRSEIALRAEPPQAGAAEKHLTQALAAARSQCARSWELRAATALARLWHGQGKAREAYDLLVPVYRWFTEGFDTADLKDAKALLDDLRGA